MSNDDNKDLPEQTPKAAEEEKDGFSAEDRPISKVRVSEVAEDDPAWQLGKKEEWQLTLSNDMGNFRIAEELEADLVAEEIGASAAFARVNSSATATVAATPKVIVTEGETPQAAEDPEYDDSATTMLTLEPGALDRPAEPEQTAALKGNPDLVEEDDDSPTVMMALEPGALDRPEAAPTEPAADSSEVDEDEDDAATVMLQLDQSVLEQDRSQAPAPTEQWSTEADSEFEVDVAVPSAPALAAPMPPAPIPPAPMPPAPGPTVPAAAPAQEKGNAKGVIWLVLLLLVGAAIAFALYSTTSGSTGGGEEADESVIEEGAGALDSDSSDATPDSTQADDTSAQTPETTPTSDVSAAETGSDVADDPPQGEDDTASGADVPSEDSEPAPSGDTDTAVEGSIEPVQDQTADTSSATQTEPNQQAVDVGANRVRLTLTSEPTNTRTYVNRIFIGRTPIERVIASDSQDVEVMLRKTGYDTLRVRLSVLTEPGPTNLVLIPEDEDGTIPDQQAAVEPEVDQQEPEDDSQLHQTNSESDDTAVIVPDPGDDLASPDDVRQPVVSGGDEGGEFQVNLDLTSTPNNVRVYVNGGVIGVTPIRYSFSTDDERAQITFRAQGYQSVSFLVSTRVPAEPRHVILQPVTPDDLLEPAQGD